MQSNLETLLEAARQLPAKDREKLAKSLLANSDDVKKRSITELRGLGKEIWQNEDAQDYVDSERDSREN